MFWQEEALRLAASLLGPNWFEAGMVVEERDRWARDLVTAAAYGGGRCVVAAGAVLRAA